MTPAPSAPILSTIAYRRSSTWPMLSPPKVGIEHSGSRPNSDAPHFRHTAASPVFSKSHEGHSIIFIDSPVITITKSSNLPELSQRRPPEQNTDDYCNNSRKPQDLTRASRNDCVRFTPHFIWPLKLSSDLPFLCESPKILCQKLAEP